MVVPSALVRASGYPRRLFEVACASAQPSPRLRRRRIVNIKAMVEAGGMLCADGRDVIVGKRHNRL